MLNAVITSDVILTVVAPIEGLSKAMERDGFELPLENNVLRNKVNKVLYTNGPS
jgi:hypothetical protein